MLLPRVLVTSGRDDSPQPVLLTHTPSPAAARSPLWSSAPKFSLNRSSAGEPERTITAFFSSTIGWDRLFNGSLPAFAGVYVVVSYTDEPERNIHFEDYGLPKADTSHCTLLLTGGTVRNVGWGDLRPNPDTIRRFERRWTFTLGETAFAFRVSPTDELVATLNTTTPRNVALGAVFLLVGAAAAFFVFDWIASRHLERVVVASVRQHAAKTGAQ